MKQIIILIATLILGATTCNAQKFRVSARANKYKVPVITAVGVGCAHLDDRIKRLQITYDRVKYHTTPSSTEMAASRTVKIEKSTKENLCRTKGIARVGSSKTSSSPKIRHKKGWIHPAER